MNKKQIFLIIGFLILNSCVSSELYLIQNDGTVRTELSKEADHDYKVFVENRWGYWDFNKHEDRVEMVKLLFQKKCDNIVVISEIPKETGVIYLTGRIAVSWEMKIKCTKSTLPIGAD